MLPRLMRPQGAQDVLSHIRQESESSVTVPSGHTRRSPGAFLPGPALQTIHLSELPRELHTRCPPEERRPSVDGHSRPSSHGRRRIRRGRPLWKHAQASQSHLSARRLRCLPKLPVQELPRGHHQAREAGVPIFPRVPANHQDPHRARARGRRVAAGGPGGWHASPRRPGRHAVRAAGEGNGAFPLARQPLLLGEHRPGRGARPPAHGLQALFLRLHLLRLREAPGLRRYVGVRGGGGGQLNLPHPHSPSGREQPRSALGASVHWGERVDPIAQQQQRLFVFAGIVGTDAGARQLGSSHRARNAKVHGDGAHPGERRHR